MTDPVAELPAHPIQALQEAQDSQCPKLDPQAERAARAQLVQALRSMPRVIYAKTPLAGRAAALGDLSRYTHITAISNERLLSIQGDVVRFRTRVNRRSAPDNAERRRVA